MVRHGGLHLGGSERICGGGREGQEGVPAGERAGAGDGIHPAGDVDAGSKGIRRGGGVRTVEFGELHAGWFLGDNAGIHGDGYAEAGLPGALFMAGLWARPMGFRIMELLFQHT
jgi:hypothetical protein